MSFQTSVIWNADDGPIPYNDLIQLGELFLKDATHVSPHTYWQITYRHTGSVLALRHSVHDVRTRLGLQVDVQWEMPDEVYAVIDWLDEHQHASWLRDWLSALPERVGAIVQA